MRLTPKEVSSVERAFSTYTDSTTTKRRTSQERIRAETAKGPHSSQTPLRPGLCPSRHTPHRGPCEPFLQVASPVPLLTAQGVPRWSQG